MQSPSKFYSEHSEKAFSSSNQAKNSSKMQPKDKVLTKQSNDMNFSSNIHENAVPIKVLL